MIMALFLFFPVKGSWMWVLEGNADSLPRGLGPVLPIHWFHYQPEFCLIIALSTKGVADIRFQNAHPVREQWEKRAQGRKVDQLT